MALLDSLPNALNDQCRLPLWRWEFKWFLALWEPWECAVHSSLVIFSWHHGDSPCICTSWDPAKTHEDPFMDSWNSFSTELPLLWNIQSFPTTTTWFRLPELQSQWDFHALLRIPLSALWSGVGLQAKNQGSHGACLISFPFLMS